MELAETKVLLKVTEVAWILGISRSTIKRKRDEGTFPPPVKIGKRAIRWKRSVIEEYYDSLGHR